ncbi:MAG: hypothetical protein Kow002_07760 [Anaerolineales bacterium]
MKRIIGTLTLISFLLGACGSAPSLWGEHPTPTPNLPFDSYHPVLAPATAIPTNASQANTPLTISPTPYNTRVVAVNSPTARPEITLSPTQGKAPVLYYAQSGDTLNAVAVRFGVQPEEITSSQSLPKTRLIDPGTLLVIPDKIDEETGPNVQIMPDTEIIFSATAVDFDVKDFVESKGGELSRYREYLSTGWNTGAESVMRLAQENSINPRILLGVLDYESNWVSGEPKDKFHIQYQMGYEEKFKAGIFRQMTWATTQLFTGYYGWRAGTLTHYTFPNGETLRIAPDLNAGTVAVQYIFSKLYNRDEWQMVLDPNNPSGFPVLYTQLFGDPWLRAQSIGPIFPPGLTQPNMELPFEPEREWNYTGGPHGAWEHDGPLAAIDFAPTTDRSGCGMSEKWITAAMSGLVVRSDRGVVVIDHDGDGYEETGWNLLYLHVATPDRVPVNTWVEVDDKIGHASCEGGVSTGTHLHMARKYNGEWVLADGNGPLPFILSGYVAYNGDEPYLGTLVKGDITIIANVYGTSISTILRDPKELDPNGQQ